MHLRDFCSCEHVTRVCSFDNLVSQILFRHAVASGLWEAIAWSYFLSNSSVCWRVVLQAQVHMSYVLKHTRVGVRLIWSDFHSKLLVTIFDSTSLLRKVLTVSVCSCLKNCSYGCKLHPRHLGSKVAKTSRLTLIDDWFPLIELWMLVLLFPRLQWRQGRSEERVEPSVSRRQLWMRTVVPVEEKIWRPKSACLLSTLSRGRSRGPARPKPHLRQVLVTMNQRLTLRWWPWSRRMIMYVGLGVARRDWTTSITLEARNILAMVAHHVSARHVVGSNKGTETHQPRGSARTLWPTSRIRTSRPFAPCGSSLKVIGVHICFHWTSSQLICFCKY